MAETKPLPDSGYRLVRTYFLQQLCEVVPADEVEEEEGDSDRPLQFFWDWRWAETGEDARPLEVRLRIELTATEVTPEKVVADIIGRFEVLGEPALSVRDFVMGPAPAMLIPYMRERISSLTSSGAYGSYHLPAINVVSLMNDMDYDITTGARQGSETEGREPGAPDQVDG